MNRIFRNWRKSGLAGLLLAVSAMHAWSQTFYWNRDPQLANTRSVNRASNWTSTSSGLGTWPVAISDDDFTADALSGPWTFIDKISDGFSSYNLIANADQLTLNARGADVYATVNQFAAVRRDDLYGDFDVTVKVLSADNTNPSAKAGIMMANDFGALAQGGYAYVAMRPDGYAEFAFDQSTTPGEIDGSYQSGSTQAFPVWLRLVRDGSSVRAFMKASQAGTWIQIGTAASPQSLGSNSEIGLFACSRNTSATLAAVFDDFQGGNDIAVPGYDFSFNGTGTNADANALVTGRLDAGSLDFTGYTGNFDFGIANGLHATLFPNSDFSGTGVERIDPTVDFNWSSGPPDGGIASTDNFSIRWDGFVQPAYSDTYTFYALVDDGARLWVDNQLIVDQWNASALAEYSGTIAMTAGAKVPVRLEYREGTAGAEVHLSWSSASVPKGVIPSGALFASRLAVSGNATFTSGMTVSPNNGLMEFTGSGTQIFVPKYGVPFPSIAKTGTGTLTLSTNSLNAGTLSLTAGSFHLGSALTHSFTAVSATGGNLDFGSSTLQVTMGNADLNGLASLSAGTGTLQFTGNSGQVFVPKASATQPNLVLGGIGGVTLSGNGYSGGSILINQGTLHLGTGLTHTVTGPLTATAGGLDFAGSTLRVGGDLSLSGLASLTPGTGTLEFNASTGIQVFTPMSGGSHPIIGHSGAGTLQLATYDLSCLGFSQTAGSLDFNGRDISTTAPGDFLVSNGTPSTFTGLAGRTLTVAGNAILAGASGASRLNLDPASAWTLAVTGSLAGSFATLANGYASVSAGTCANCPNSGGNSNWAFSVTWDGGGADDNWTTPQNWGSDAVPTMSDAVTFDGSSSKNAVLDAAAGVKSIALDPSYTGTFDFSSNTLTVSGGDADLRSGGAVNASSGTLAFTSPTPQNFQGKSGMVLGSIVQNGSGGTSYLGPVALSAGSLICDYGTFGLGSGSYAHQIGSISGSSGGLDFQTSDVYADGNVDFSGLSVTAVSVGLHFTGASPQTYTPNASLTGLQLVQAGTGGTTVSGYAFTAPALSISGGTFHLGTGLIHAISGAFSASGGGLDFGSSTLQVQDAAFDLSGLSTLTAGTGTLEFTSPSPQTFIPTPSVLHPDIRISGNGGVTMATHDLDAGTLFLSGGSFTLGAGRTVSTTGLSLTAGTLDFGSGTLKTSASSVNLDNVALAGTSTGILEFTSSGAQAFTPNSAGSAPAIVQSGSGTTALSTNDLSTPSLTVAGGGFDLITRTLTANAIDITAGILAANAGNIFLTGDLSATGGELKCPAAGTFNVTGSVLISAAAVLTPSTGTLTLTGSSPGNTLDIGNPLYGLTVNGGGGAWTVVNHGLRTDGPLSLAAGDLSLGSGLSHEAGSVASAGGALDFGSGVLKVLYGNADFSGLSTLTAGTGTLEFSAVTGTQILIAKLSAAHPAIAHTGAGTLQFGTFDIACNGFSNSAGGLDFNGRSLSIDNGGNLNLSNGTTATISNLGGSTIAVSGDATLSGTSAASRLNLDPAGAWTLAVTGALNASYVSLANCNASAAPGTAYYSADGGGNSGWSFPISWTGGGVDNNWSTSANWENGSLPGAGSTVSFGSGSPKNVLLDADTTVKTLIFDSAYSGTFDFSTHTLTVLGDADFRSGGALLPGTGTLAFAGSVSHTLIPKEGPGMPTIEQNGTGATTVSTVPLEAAGLAVTSGPFYLVSGVHSVGSLSGSGSLDFGSATLRTAGNVDVSAMSLVPGTGTLEFNGASPQTFTPKAGGSLPALVQAGAGGTTVIGNGFSASSLSIVSGTLALGAGLSHAVSDSLSVSGGGLDFGTSSLAVAAPTVDLSGLSTLTAAGATLSFTGAAPQTFTPKAGAIHPALLMNGAGGVTLAGDLDARSLALSAGALHLGAAFTHSVDSLSSPGGSLDFGGSSLHILSGNADFSGLSSLTSGSGGLYFDGSATQVLTPHVSAGLPAITRTGATGLLRLGGNLSCAGLSITAGGFDFAGFELTITGSGDLVIAGGGASTFANLGGRTLTVGGDASLSGLPGDHLGLNPGAAWTLAVSGSLAAVNADIGGSLASLSAGVADSSLNLGGNSNWSFLDSIKPQNVTAFQAEALDGHSVALSWTASIAADADSVMLRYRTNGAYPSGPTDGTLWRTVPRTLTADTATGLADKTLFAFAAFAEDSSGNYALAAAGSLDTARTPDVTPPANVTAFAATAYSASSTALSWTASTGTDADSVMIRYRSDGVPPAGAADGTLLRMLPASRIADTATGLAADLIYGFSAFVRDSSGNYSAAAAGASDTSLYQTPVTGSIAIADQAGRTRNTAPALAFTYAGADSLRFALPADTGSAAWLGLHAADSLDMSAGADGIRIALAQFKNMYGTRSAWFLDTTYLDRTGPVISHALNASYGWRNWPDAIAGEALDAIAGTDSVFVVRKRLSDGAYYNGSVWTIAADTARLRTDSAFSAPMPGSAMATGSYEFGIWAVDKLGNPSAVSTVPVAYQQNRAPTAGAATLADTAFQGASVSWALEMGDADAGDSVSTVTATLPSWLSMTQKADTAKDAFAARRTYAFTGTPAQGDVGTAVVTVQARDLGGLTATYTRSIAVIDVNDAPVFSAGQDSLVAREDSLTRFVPLFTDPDPMDTHALALLQAPAWASLEDTALVFRPGSRDVESALVRLTVGDGKLLDTLDLRVRVADVNDPPVAFPGPGWLSHAQWKEDAVDTFTVVVVDMDAGDPITLATALPGWLTWKAATDTGKGYNRFFRFTARPLQADTGTFPFNLRFQDAAGLYSELPLEAKVASVNDTPTAVVKGVETHAGAARIALDVSDQDGTAVSTRYHYRLIGSAGDTLRRGICGTPTLALHPLADGAYRLAVKAEDEGGLRQPGFTIANLSIAGATALALDSARWNMIGYPGRMLSAKALGSGSAVTTWDEAAADGTPLGRYSDGADGANPDSLARGKGYWIRPAGSLALKAPFAELLDRPFAMKLSHGRQGWNQVGNPFPYYVDLSASGLTFWEWDAAARDLVNVHGILKPWGAYWVLVPRDTILTVKDSPYFPAAGVLAKSASADTPGFRADGDWSLQLSLKAGAYRDQSNFLGIRKVTSEASGAGTGASGIDAAPAPGRVPDAPKFGDFIALHFEKPGEKARTADPDSLSLGYSSDFRARPGADEEWWDFSLENSGSGLDQAELSLPGLAALEASGLHAFLVRRGEASPAISTAPAMLAMDGSSTHYSLVVTPHADFAERLKGSFSIAQNFPNPVTTQTAFRFFLPQTWDAEGRRQARTYRLRLNVYDFQGRLAARIADGGFTPGSHTLIWKPKSLGGGGLAKGAYVYRLEIPGFTKSLKLLLK